MRSSIFGPKPVPAREQNLLISKSKHLYLTKDGCLRHQKKEIDPRLPGTKTLLNRLVLLDVDTGVVYCELRPVNEDIDLLGFLARAWSLKPDHPMRGFPQKLSVPKVAIENADMLLDLQMLADWGKFSLHTLPSGFTAGIHAVKKFENQLLFWSGCSDHLDIYTIDEFSALNSCMASSGTSAYTSKEIWASVQPPEASFTQMVDRQYANPAAWRLDSFAPVFDGIKPVGQR